ncbi:dihydroorotase [Candidatus Woesearchaeota archaeon]|nr:dihydroorotase [Candidatus Woesearchaeota archaeon]|tara:strand:+ start:6241 stop:7536 length:1296 start_codon:yes stop_codon:yes gene_type:complete
MTLSILKGKVLVKGKLENRNILIEDGKIIEVTEDTVSSNDKINAEGKIILPGLIDCHVHLREPGLTQKEDFKTGSMAAAAGGVTSVFEMPNTNPATTTLQLLQEKKELAKKSIVNYGLYMGATTDNIEEIKKAENIAGVKLYMGSSTGNLLVTDKEAIKNVFDSGKTVVVHAEDEELMNKNAEHYKDEKDPVIHAKIRSNEVEATAIKSAVLMVGNNKVHFTHTSTKESMEIIKEAKKNNSNISCDVTPHHLFLTYEELKTQRNFAKMNPALRNKEDVEALWKAIDEGIVDCIATDHAGHTKDEKEADYWEAPSGVPGLETMLPLLLDAVNKGRITLEKVTELTSINPAKIFGVKNKGKIEKGYDADLVIVDMNMEKEIKNEELFTKCGWSPFNGWKLKGWPVTTIVNGNIVFDDGEISEANGKEVEFKCQ